VEITEHLLAHPAKSVDEAVAQLVALGVELGIDDFGTGYASLSYLQRFPASILKIDHSFIQGMETGEKGSNLVEAILTMAQKLGMRVVAEGVETAEQRDRLKALGCNHAQGYLFAKPLAEEQATALIAAGLGL
jgi:EAL domain-containing protein (putative c-di-GMP-specific phosphodiesterase class I)